MELIFTASVLLIFAVFVVALHLGAGTYIANKFITRDENGKIPWLNLRNTLLILVLISLFSLHLWINGIIGGS